MSNTAKEIEFPSDELTQARDILAFVSDVLSTGDGIQLSDRGLGGLFWIINESEIAMTKALNYQNQKNDL